MGRGRTPRHPAECKEPIVATDAGSGPRFRSELGAFTHERGFSFFLFRLMELQHLKDEVMPASEPPVWRRRLRDTLALAYKPTPDGYRKPKRFNLGFWYDTCVVVLLV